MNFRNVKLILSREVRDQLRDRRTLFMVFVLPVLLYPMLGVCFLQVQQLTRQQRYHVWIVGISDVEEFGLVPMLDRNGPGDQFSPELISDPRQLQLAFARAEPEPGSGPADESEDAIVQWFKQQRAEAWEIVQSGEYDAALVFPHGFADQLKRFHQGVQGEPLMPEVLYTNKNDRSIAADMRLGEVLGAWSRKVGEATGKHLADDGVRIMPAMPIRASNVNVDADTPYQGAALWSKILPVLLLIWAMTGAFYPAVDLCAGEKERGTLETLLSSPAERSEIVLGKLGTIMIFSMATAALNMASVGTMGWLVFSKLPNVGPPPPMGLVWLGVALVPVSALFSALCLALAAFARSSKEGQYYLMPLLLVIMPLAVLPMTSAVELNMGTALVPITGVVLVLRNVLEGNFAPVLQYGIGVVVVTLGACFMAIRWAIDQFNSESVLFRESEQLDVGIWLRHLWRDRRPTPTVAAAMACAVLILLAKCVTMIGAEEPGSFGELARSTVVSQVAIFALPAVLMALLLTRSPRDTLLLRRPPWMAIPAALVLAVAVHPITYLLKTTVERLYPIGGDTQKQLAGLQILLGKAPLWQLLLLIAVTPAICEELAFRGFILSGLRHLGHKWRAIACSAVMFGIVHIILQQSIIAALLGAMVGYVAVQSGSIFPCMAFHMAHNGLILLSAHLSPALIDRWHVRGMVSSTDTGPAYTWTTLVLGVTAAGIVLWWFSRLSYAKSSEEELQAAIHRAAEGFAQ